MVMAELNALYEIAMLGPLSSEAELGRQSVEKASRLFSARRFALLKGPRGKETPIASWGFRPGEEPRRKTAKESPRRFRRVFSLDQHNSSIFFIELSRPITPRENRLLTIFARRVEDLLRSSLNVSERLRAEETARRLAEIVRNATDGVILTDSEGRIVYVNPAFERMSGYSLKKMTGRDPGELIVAPDPPAVGEMIRETVRKKGEWIGELVVRDRGGRRYPVESRVFPILDSEGKIVQIAAIQQDITRRKKAERAIRESESRYRTLFERSGNPIMIIDEKGIYLEANSAALDFLETTREELVGRNILDTIPPDVNPEELLARHRPLWKSGGRVETEYYVKGAIKVLDLSISPGRWKDRPVVFGIGADITQRKQAEKAVRKLLSEAEASRRALLSVVEDQKIAEEALRRRLDLESFLTDFTLRCINLPPEELDRAINAALEGIGPLVGADRSYVFLIDDADETINNTHEWCAAGIPPQRENLQKIPRQSMPWWMDKMEKGGLINVAAVAALPPAAAAEREILLDQEIQSVLSVPIFGRGRLVGFLGFDAVRKSRTWTTDDIGILETLANTLALLLERARGAEERRALQSQLVQTQKMDSVGRLAGGVAHDFNNMLSVIIGYTEMALGKVEPSLPLHGNLKEVLQAARNSADLTRQLLAFARLQPAAPQVIDLNEAITTTLPMARHLVGEAVELVWRPAERLWPVKIDPSQVQQIMVNLVINARDSIPGVGSVTITTANRTLDKSFTRTHPGFIPGEYVTLAVEDTGTGMDADTLERIFEPFFTTKKGERGTGLGLPTVYGIVKQNRGFIYAYSEPDHGSIIRIYLPRAGTEEGGVVPSPSPEIVTVRGDETVLLVDDDEGILRVAKVILSEQGYRVLAAGSPFTALGLAEKHRDEIKVLVTDVVMPEMGGRELARKISKIIPAVKTVFISGYPDEMGAEQVVAEDLGNFIQKPFSIEELAIKIRAALKD